MILKKDWYRSTLSKLSLLIYGYQLTECNFFDYLGIKL
jgi:hypothetical protein